MATKKQWKNKKAVFGWMMYDFANSAFTTLIVTFIYATYFTKAIAPDEITGTVLWSRAITASTVAVALLSPYLGRKGDQGSNKKRYLFLFTVIAVFSSTMLYTVLPGETGKALCWFILGNIAFEMGMVFYNAFLPEIATEKNIGRISGIGWGVGYFGGLAAMFLAMTGFVNAEVPWFGLAKETGQHIRATNLLVAAWFSLFSLPIFLLLKEKQTQTRQLQPINKWQDLRATLTDLLRYGQAVRFLAARLLFNDGLITIFAFGGIYAASTFKFTFEEIMVFGIVLNIAAGFGALIMGWVDDLLGSRKTIMISLIGLIIASLLAILSPNRTFFWTAGILVGIFSGPNQAASRTLMARLVPREKQGQFFGFFAFSGKLTAFLGPLLFGIMTDIFKSQRAGMTIVVALLTAGALIMTTVDEDKGIREKKQTKPSPPQYA